MKSSKDIQPRVGMQVRFDGRVKTERKRVSRVAGGIKFDNDTTAMPCGSGGVWDAGEYKIEWTPPTDEERRMFMEAADRLVHGVIAGWKDTHDDCHEKGWNRRKTGLMDYEHMAAIADSLALDGADYDCMPPGYEWHPPERSKR